MELPLHGSFFGGVDFGHRLRFTKEIAFDVVKEKVLGIGICEIQTVMVDDLSLLLQPVAPAGLADLVVNSLAQFVGKWREREGGSLLATVFALDWFRHCLVSLSTKTHEKTRTHTKLSLGFFNCLYNVIIFRAEQS